MNRKQIILSFGVVLAALAYFMGGGSALLSPHHYLTLFQQFPVSTMLAFFAIYVLGTALSLPVMVTLSVVSGAVFGLGLGVALAVFACSIGGTLAYLFSRHLLRDWVHRRFAEQFEVVNRGVERDGSFYLFSVRMMPVIPFWLVNLAVGLTAMRPWQFFFATLFGMLPITFILANFGSQLGSIESFSVNALLSPGLLLSLMLLALLPLSGRWVAQFVSSRRGGQWGREQRVFPKPTNDK